MLLLQFLVNFLHKQPHYVKRPNNISQHDRISQHDPFRFFRKAPMLQCRAAYIHAPESLTKASATAVRCSGRRDEDMDMGAAAMAKRHNGACRAVGLPGLADRIDRSRAVPPQYAPPSRAPAGYLVRA